MSLAHSVVMLSAQCSTVNATALQEIKMRETMPFSDLPRADLVDELALKPKRH
jgi:hypothetical protein